ncbi:cobyric acid synthase [Roseburia sp. 499]|uniref:cobyric acid synthase n=1 Tax=Roseburia sp. 499 TaxID=1261634 RepID=UPI0009532DBD|nr:cobyric acid synthase [Roseburia sp. 499]WVK70734.1 cobyric acid synthase [Roseburia sp. 499]
MAKSIMIQGTMSNVGKSLIAAGLCRIFKQDGYKVAPFKSQNMALNSYITKEGLEMGRAQVVQAEAAGVEPSVFMNPILLKPTNDIGSQVIVNGEVIGNMSAREYFAYKKQLIPEILKAYENLDKEYDIIVIEGAGSPAEINLKQDDIVNMGMAKMVKAPVLLVGDIDRGGVFAQLVGTIMLLEDDEKAMIKGTIINKFRGDKTILDPGIEMLEEMTKIPVVGVTPYMQVDIEDEDSLSERFARKNSQGVVDIAVIRLPRISNFTDFAVLEGMAEVNLRYVDRVEKLGNPDMILLPGTKNTMADLRWLRESGLEAAILKAQQKGTVIFGICGGYQMLGELLEDPEGVEEGGTLRGMGLLPAKTIFTVEKTRTRVSGEIQQFSGMFQRLSGKKLEGYEIHMGVTSINGKAESFSIISEEGKVSKSDGACIENVYGTYVHGIFDEDGIAEELVRILAEKKGIYLEEQQNVDRHAHKESQYDLLADTLRKYLDMDRVYEILL